MVSSLFDPVIDRAIRTARRNRKKFPPPPLLVPLLSFKTMPNKAKEVVLEVLESDEAFRKRVARGVTEAEHGRFAHDYLVRPDGWETFIANMIEADGPMSDPSSSSVAELGDVLEMATAARASAEADAAQLRRELDGVEQKLDAAQDAHDDLMSKIASLERQVEELQAERQRAVTELKTTESVMARHVTARKQLEATIEQMTSAQLASTTVGGSITDEEVRVGLEAINFTLDELRDQLGSLRRAATPERIDVARRVPLTPPLGLLDDSVEFASYLLSVPNIAFLVDGYNVTKQAVPELALAEQRAWLERVITDRLPSMNGRIEVIFDGIDDLDAVQSGQGAKHPQLRVRFSPEGVEADDVIIASVKAQDARTAVVVVSSDNRVREGAKAGGANVLHSKQFKNALT